MVKHYQINILKHVKKGENLINTHVINLSPSAITPLIKASWMLSFTQCYSLSDISSDHTLVTFCCCLLYGQVDVSLKHSPFPLNFISINIMLFYFCNLYSITKRNLIASLYFHQTTYDRFYMYMYIFFMSV